MFTRREEIEFEMELLELEEKFLAAKATGDRKHPDRVRFSETRRWIRQVRDGEAPAPVKSKSKG